MDLKWRSVPAGHCDRTYKTACLISVASIGARGCVVDCLAARMGKDDSKDVDMDSVQDLWKVSTAVSYRRSPLTVKRKETIE